MLAGEIVNGPEAALHLEEPLGVEVERLRHGAERGARLGCVDRRGFDQIQDFVGARVVTRHHFEVTAGAGECARRRLGVIAVEPIESPTAAVEDRLRVREPALVGRESLGFIGVEPQPVELIELEAKEVEPGRTVLAVRDDPVELTPERPPPLGRLRDLLEQRVMIAEVVDEEPLAILVEQQVMRVLAVDVDEVLTEIAQQVRGHRTIVDERARSAPGADYPPHDALARAVVELAIGEPRPGRCVRFRFEHAADLGPLGPGADHVRVGPRAEKQPQRVDDDGLPRARLAGERGHPR